MKKKVFLTLAMGAMAFGLFFGGQVGVLTDLPFELVTK
ncbi:hypothetical protein SAMN05428946_2033 [Edaphobacillus lindanitolerans]|uniref:Uncharacterized protein n=1 Tax=Edaphobacillus lindanitolerans TaxID=550447 RepID=A0A1U7PQW9_9BACI|nr:hypothetical protein SAMN05428946_2033 [Edaphobacillus lindanitolerans]